MTKKEHKLLEEITKTIVESWGLNLSRVDCELLRNYVELTNKRIAFLEAQIGRLNRITNDPT